MVWTMPGGATASITSHRDKLTDAKARMEQVEALKQATVTYKLPWRR